jgi:predicted transcriptional regulator
MVGAGSNHPHALSQSTFRKPQISGERDTKNQKQKTDMKKLIMKLLGLESLVTELAELKKFQRDLATAQEGLSAKVDEVSEKVDEIETPDMDDYVLHSDLDDNVESYLNNNDYATQSYVDDEVENKVSDAVESAVEDIDLTDKVKEVVDDMDKASFGDTEEIEQAVSKAVKEALSKAYYAVKNGL